MIKLIYLINVIAWSILVLIRVKQPRNQALPVDLRLPALDCF
jgi:hypothetical protein